MSRYTKLTESDYMKLASLTSYCNEHLPDRYSVRVRFTPEHFCVFIYDDAVNGIACSWIMIPSCELKKTIKEVKVWIAHVNIL